MTLIPLVVWGSMITTTSQIFYDHKRFWHYISIQHLKAIDICVITFTYSTFCLFIVDVKLNNSHLTQHWLLPLISVTTTNHLHLHRPPTSNYHFQPRQHHQPLTSNIWSRQPQSPISDHLPPPPPFPSTSIITTHLRPPPQAPITSDNHHHHLRPCHHHHHKVIISDNCHYPPSGIPPLSTSAITTCHCIQWLTPITIIIFHNYHFQPLFIKLL